MLRTRNIRMIFLLMLAAAIAWATSPLRAENPPTSQPSEPKLPLGAIRRLGDLRFADIGSRGGFFSTDNKRLISYGDELVIWDAASGWDIYRYKATDHLMAHAAYFGANQIAVACNGTTTDRSSDIIVLDEKTGGLVRRIDRPWTGGFSEFTTAPDGSRFAVVTDHILLCDGQTGQTIRDLGAKPAPANGGSFFFGPRIAFSGDSKTLVAVTFDGEAHVIDPTTGQDKIDHTFSASLGANISSDGKTLATLPDDHDLHLFDLPSGDELPVPPVEIVLRPDQPAQRFSVQRIVFARHDGMLAYTYSGPGINLLDTSERPLKLPRRITPAGFGGGQPILSDDGSLLAIQYGNTGRRMILDTQTAKPVTPASISMQSITALAVSPDGQELLAGDSQGELYRWDLQQGKMLVHRDRTTATDFVGRGGIYRLSYFENGKMVLENGGADTRICDSKTLATKRRLSQQQASMGYNGPGMCISPDARWMVALTNKSSGVDMELTDRKTNTTTIVQHEEQPYDSNSQLRPGLISPDGTLLYAGSSEGPRFVDLITHQTGPVIRIGNPRDPGGGHVRFSPDSRWVLMQLGLKNALYESRKLTQMPDAAPAGNPPAGGVIVNGRQVPRTPISKLPPLWTHDTISTFEGDADFSGSSELVVIMSTTGADNHVEIAVFEVRTGKLILTLPTVVPRSIATRFVPGKLQVVTADRAGTVLLWDLRTLLLAGKDLSAEQDKTEDQLWTLLSDPDPVPAYRAGLVLLDRHQLLGRAAALAPLPSTDIRGDTSDAHQMIQALSSPIPADREKAHKALEAAGSAVIREVRTALDSHPGGELEDRLKDIAHVIGADDPTIPTPTAPPSTAPIANADTLRTARVIQLLEWSDDPKAAEQRARLTPAADAHSK